MDLYYKSIKLFHYNNESGQGWVFVAQQLTLPPLETSDVVCPGFRVVESRQTYHGDRVSSLAAIHWSNTQEPEPARGEAAPFTGLPSNIKACLGSPLPTPKKD